MRELTSTEQHHVYGGLKAKDFPRVTVRPDPGTGGGGGGYARPPQASPPSPPRGGGGGGGGSSPTYGNYNLRADTLEHRLEIANLVQGDLEKLGYHMPNGYHASYVDEYAYKNKITGEVRYSGTRSGALTNEVEIAATTRSSDHTIYLFHGAVDPQLGNDGFFHWNTILQNAATGKASLTGTLHGATVDGGINAVAMALSTLAHEEYHASGHWTATNDDTNDPNELRANTYGYIAERAFNQAILDERK